MKIAGIVLIVLQALVVLGSLIGGKNPFAGGIFEIIGYFLVGIIGVILLVIGIKKNKK